MDISRPAFSHHYPGFWNKCHGVSKKHIRETLYQGFRERGCIAGIRQCNKASN